jgi:hypothetical protein
MKRAAKEAGDPEPGAVYAARRTSWPVPHRQRYLSTAIFEPPMTRSLRLSSRWGYSTELHRLHLDQLPGFRRSVV